MSDESWGSPSAVAAQFLVCERPGCGTPYARLKSPPWDLPCGHGLCGPCCAAEAGDSPSEFLDRIGGLVPSPAVVCPACGAPAAQGELHMNVRAWMVATRLRLLPCPGPVPGSARSRRPSAAAAAEERRALEDTLRALEAGIDAEALAHADADLDGAVLTLRVRAARLRDRALGHEEGEGRQREGVQHEERPRPKPRQRVRVRVATTGLAEAAGTAVGADVRRLGGEVVSDAGDCTTLTHLITPAAGRSGEDDAGCLAKRTMKYVFAVAAGCAEVVRMDWVAASREAGGWAAVDGFRVETDALAAAAGHPRGGPGRGREAARGERPKLLAGRSVRLHGTFRGKGEPSRRDLGRVAELLGAFLCEGPVRSEAATTGGPSLVVVCDQASAVRGGKRVSAGRGGRKRARGVEEEGKEEGNGQGAPPHVHWGWLLDCAGSYTLLPTAGYTVDVAAPTE